MGPTESSEPTSQPATHQMIELLHHEALMRSMGLQLAQLDAPATVALPEQHRAGWGSVVAYEFGGVTILRADPVLAAAIDQLADPGRALSLEDIRAWADASGWAIVEGSDSHVVTLSALRRPPPPNGSALITLDRGDPVARRRIADLIDVCDPGDLDEAELSIDDLDPIIVALLDDEGDIGAYASGRPWEENERFDDTAVITRKDLRGRGWGRAIVSAFCQASFELGRLPLYRCDWSRPASKALALSLGFVRTMSLMRVSPAASAGSVARSRA